MTKRISYFWLFVLWVSPVGISELQAQSLSIGTVHGVREEVVSVPITLDASQNSTAILARLEYDPLVLENPMALPGALLTSEHTLSSHAPEPGLFNVSINADSGSPAFSETSGVVFHVSFTIRGSAAFGASPIVFRESGVPDTPVSNIVDVSGALLPHTTGAGGVIVEGQLPSLTVNAVHGTVTMDPPGPLYYPGTEVTLTATPDYGYHFTAWSQDASGTTNPLTLVMTKGISVTALFTLNMYALNVSAKNGSVEVMPELPMYAHGSSVTLSALPDVGFHFDQWVGDVSGTSTSLLIRVTGDTSVTAQFAITTYSLIVLREHGDVLFSPSLSVYEHGSTVSLTAIPETGYAFVGWSGDIPADTEEVNPLTITMNADLVIAAEFTPLPDPANYKVTYKLCALDIEEGNDGLANISVTGSNVKSSIKIQKLSKLPKNMAEKEGVKYLLDLRIIPEMYVDGALGKFFSEAEIMTLMVSGGVKSITTNNANIAWIEAISVGSIKMTSLAEAEQGKTVATSVLITGTGKPMKASFNGLILENFVSEQPLKSLTVASKAFKMPSKAKAYSLGGVGAASRVVAQAKGEANIPIEGDSLISAPTIMAFSTKGAPLTPDTIHAGLSKILVQGGAFKTSTIVTVAADLVVRRLISSTSIKSITGKAKNVSGVAVGGRIGSLADPALTRIQAAGDIKSISGEDISAIFWAGFTADAPTHTGMIKKIKSKGTLAGEAHVSTDAIKIKAIDQTGFAVLTE